MNDPSVTPPSTPAPAPDQRPHEPPRPIDLPSSASMLELVFPKDTNYLGTAFGGFVLSLMDKVASVAANRHARGTVVTARMDAVDFRVPVRSGDALALTAWVIGTGRSSMTVQVEVHREQLTSGEQQLATTGQFVFVHVDEHGKPCPVPPLAGPPQRPGGAGGR